MATLFLTGGNRGIDYYMVKQWLADGNSAAVQHAVDQTIATFGAVDVAVHNACLCLFRPLEELTPEDYRRVMDVNLLGAVHLAQAVLPHMKQRRAGKLCFISSGVGVHLLHPPLMDTESSSPLPVPREFKAKARRWAPVWLVGWDKGASPSRPALETPSACA